MQRSQFLSRKGKTALERIARLEPQSRPADCKADLMSRHVPLLRWTQCGSNAVPKPSARRSYRVLQPREREPWIVGSGGRRAIPLRVPKPYSCPPPGVCIRRIANEKPPRSMLNLPDSHAVTLYRVYRVYRAGVRRGRANHNSAHGRGYYFTSIGVFEKITGVPLENVL